MTLWDGSGQADGLTSAAATAALRFGAGATAAGVGTNPSPTATMALGPGGVALVSGVAGGSAAGNLDGVLAGLAAGVAIVVGETHPFGAGVASGTGLLADAPGVLLHGAAGTAAGTGAATASVGVLYIVTGQTGGVGQLLYDNLIETGGLIIGQATVQGAGQRFLTAWGRVFGTSKMVFSAPMLIYGTSILTGYAEVTCVPLPVNAIVAPPKSFRYLQLLQRGDLPIYISDQAGPVSPVRVFYTLYQLRPDGTRFQVGPGSRVPAQGVVGEYYATGRAGESGQPGTWVIRWEFQRTFQSTVQEKEMRFQVLDAVLAKDPRDVTPRVRKYGWN